MPIMNVSMTSVTRWGLNLLALLGIIVALWLGKAIFIPTVIAVLLAALLWPFAVGLKEKLHLPWSVACLTSVGSLVVLVILVTLGFTFALIRILPNPTDQQEHRRLYENFRNQLIRVSPFLDERFLDERFPEDPEKSPVYASIKKVIEQHGAQFLLNALNHAKSWLWDWVLIMFILIFLLLEGRMLSRRIVEISGPSAEAQQAVVACLSDMSHQVRTYLVWRTIVNIGLGLVVGMFYHMINLRQPWLWALLTAVLCYIPYLGPIAAGVPPLIDAFVSCESPWYVIAILVFYLAVVTVEGYVVVPVVMGRSMELNATTVMLACLFWDLVWGMPGLFLAMPIMAAIKAVCIHVPDWRPIANLMGTSEDDLPGYGEVITTGGTVVMSDGRVLATEQTMPAEEAVEHRL